MSRYRCNTCSGEYGDIQADGALYFHVCPPVVVDPATGATRERPDKRDENVILDPATGQVRIKAEGKGRTVIV